jgi:hypothetical protein
VWIGITLNRGPGWSTTGPAYTWFSKLPGSAFLLLGPNFNQAKPLQVALLIARVGEAILQGGRISGIPTVLWPPLKPEAGHPQGAAAFEVRRPNQGFRPSPFDNAGILSSRPRSLFFLRCMWAMWGARETVGVCSHCSTERGTVTSKTMRCAYPPANAACC